jgi:hypothetical protein
MNKEEMEVLDRIAQINTIRQGLIGMDCEEMIKHISKSGHNLWVDEDEDDPTKYVSVQFFCDHVHNQCQVWLSLMEVREMSSDHLIRELTTPEGGNSLQVILRHLLNRVLKIEESRFKATLSQVVVDPWNEYVTVSRRADEVLISVKV